jgi:hypothetical protein
MVFLLLFAKHEKIKEGNYEKELQESKQRIPLGTGKLKRNTSSFGSSLPYLFLS